MDGEIAAILNQEGFAAARGCAFNGENVSVLRTRWSIHSLKISCMYKTPMPRPDGSFSILKKFIWNALRIASPREAFPQFHF
ncbi:hypothetical protein GGD65_004159 [Bradyrhizobium sp. CIR18]|uniref:hypothetical protein n=1 Tax=Bradyrhizobium sp. CIR18 TaxID=2663839 RepID=UPI0016059DFA|nr:hypothetical protein [Bradyrhizobium sp. CIR18]MBB4363126.1 hypothetical protein [Bradyrhizobium sp. CIR18]